MGIVTKRENKRQKDAGLAAQLNAAVVQAAAVPVNTPTTDVFVEVFTHANSNGLVGGGSIKNTGAQGIDVKESATDLFGVLDSSTVSVAAGDSLLLSTMQNLGSARPPYSSYKVEVKSTNAGMPGTYKLFHSSVGAE